MKLRILLASLGLVLAIVGLVAVTLYTRGADERALRDQQPIDVLVVARDVPAGTPADQLSAFLEVKALPQSAVATGAATTLDGLGGLVAAVDLMTGEQLLTTRMVSPDALEVPGRVDVPAGLQELTLLLSAERVVGGGLAPGDTVGVVISSQEPQQTHMLFQRVLVTTLQGLAPAAEEDTGGAAPVPEGSVYVTLAVRAPDAERIVFGAEHGSIWLTKEPLDADPSGTGVVTPDSVFP